MRITSGIFKGSSLIAPNTKLTHPMSEKIRSAMFNALGDISGLMIADCYAGSGAVGFEALSRQAAKVVAIERDRTAIGAIRLNLKSLNNPKNYVLYDMPITQWLKLSDDLFDVILADPPFGDIHEDVLLRLMSRLSPTGLLLLCLPSKAHLFGGKNEIQLVIQKLYGDAQLVGYRHK